MSDRKGDDLKKPPECLERGERLCPHLKELDPENMSGETYSCEVCGRYYYLDYDEMR